MTTQIKIALPGAGGRMGRMITQLVAESDDMMIAAATETAASPLVGQKIGSCTVSSQSDALGVGPGGVIIDFSHPLATARHIQIAQSSTTPMVIGTTGLGANQETLLKAAAASIPIVYCANTSIGVAVVSQIVEQVAAQLGTDWDIEIAETHHNQKIDAPSGTALALGHAAARGRKVQLDAVRDSGRDGETGQRKKGDIGFAVMRGGDIAGEHTVTFFGQQERIEITHRATSRIVFARGALRAARFVTGQPPGLYSIDDVLAHG